MNSFDIYLMGDQPTTCPKCGIRTEITLELLEFSFAIQFHKCPSEKCKYSFIVEKDVVWSGHVPTIQHPFR